MLLALLIQVDDILRRRVEVILVVVVVVKATAGGTQMELKGSSDCSSRISDLSPFSSLLRLLHKVHDQSRPLLLASRRSFNSSRDKSTHECLNDFLHMEQLIRRLLLNALLQHAQFLLFLQYERPKLRFQNYGRGYVEVQIHDSDADQFHENDVPLSFLRDELLSERKCGAEKTKPPPWVKQLPKGTEMKVFLGFLIFSGYHTLPSDRDYWSEDEDLGAHIAKNAMSRNAYNVLKGLIHFQDDSQAKDSKDRLFKHFAIDEIIVRYYGHYPIKQFIRSKPIRFRCKLWALCGDSGLLQIFSVLWKLFYTSWITWIESSKKYDIGGELSIVSHHIFR
nr:unnamed protein product [Callosobruchus analis]